MRSPKAFSILLILATLLPFAACLLASAGANHAGASMLVLLALAGSPHVAATSVLFADASNLRRVAAQPFQLAFMPAAIFAATLVAMNALPRHGVMLAFVAYVLAQTWHFGMQNVGVVAFVRLAAGAGPASRFERASLSIAAACGVLGAYRSFAPAFMNATAFDTGSLDGLGSAAWTVGAAAYAATIVVSGLYVVARRDRFGVLSGTAYMASICFFLPIYVYGLSLNGIEAYLVSHGLQYQIFLFYAAAGRGLGRSLAARALGVASFLGINVAWLAYPEAFARSAAILGLATGTNFALAAAHFWIDRSVWRLRDSERRAWVRERFDFLFPSASPPSA